MACANQVSPAPAAFTTMFAGVTSLAPGSYPCSAEYADGTLQSVDIEGSWSGGTYCNARGPVLGTDTACSWTSIQAFSGDQLMPSLL